MHFHSYTSRLDSPGKFSGSAPEMYMGKHRFRCVASIHVRDPLSPPSLVVIPTKNALFTQLLNTHLVIVLIPWLKSWILHLVFIKKRGGGKNISSLTRQILSFQDFVRIHFSLKSMCKHFLFLKICRICQINSSLLGVLDRLKFVNV